MPLVAANPTMIAIGIHGGCGTLPQDMMTAAQWSEARTHLADALRAGWAVLARGGVALDAVESAVVATEENSPYFNSGYGAAMNTDGVHELDSAIMDGASLPVGAACAARRIRNPVRAAARRSKTARACGSPDRRPTFRWYEGPRTRRRTSSSPRNARRTHCQAQAATRRTIAAASEAESRPGGRGGARRARQPRGGHFHRRVQQQALGQGRRQPIVGAGTDARNGVCAVFGTGRARSSSAALPRTTWRRAWPTRALRWSRPRGRDHAMVLHRIGAGMVAIDAQVAW